MGVEKSSASLAAMYQEALLSHYRRPHNRREMEDPTATALFRNPVCGDEIKVFVRIDGDTISDVSFQGRGCSVATASASIMTDAVRGGSVREARQLSDGLERALGEPSLSNILPDVLAPLRSVVAFPGRHGCVRMAWQALREALDSNR